MSAVTTRRAAVALLTTTAAAWTRAQTLPPELIRKQQVADAFAELGLVPRPLRVADAVTQVTA